MNKIKCDMKGCCHYYQGYCCKTELDSEFKCPVLEDYLSLDVSDLEHSTITMLINNSLIDDDEELNHVEADDILCEFLEKLGYKRLVDVYRLVDKWYA